MSRGMMTLYALVFLVFSLLGYWFYSNFTWVVKEVDVGFQGRAKTNQLLASEMFLRKMGVPVHQVTSLSELRHLPSTQTTILIATQRKTINKELSQHLLNWIYAGGHLIVEAQYQADKTKQGSEKDALLANYSLYTKQNKTKRKAEKLPISVFLERSLSKISVDFIDNRSLSDAAYDSSWSIVHDKNQYLMQFHLGTGLLTVLSSTKMFRNRSIAKYDNAQFLHYLVQFPNHNQGVWLLRIDDMPALWLWLWHSAFYALLSLVLLLILFLWRAPFRFGPLLNDQPQARRSLLEHIQANGYYRWHNKQSAYLLAQVQQRVWRKAEKMHPAINRDNYSQACDLLVNISGINRSAIDDALQELETLAEYELLQKVKVLKLLEQSL